MIRNIFFILVLLLTNSAILLSQEILLQEDFDDCQLPTGWSINVSNNQDAGLYFGSPTNTNSDSLSIDGTCMVVFDDDLLGNNQPTFVGELKTPLVNLQDFQTIRLETDIVFREYDTTSFTVFIEEINGNRIPIRVFNQDDQTGTSFSDFTAFNIDLSFFTSEPQVYIVYQYDDKNMYGWWAGIDNVRITGSGKGTKVFAEQFNDCQLPEGWTNNILEGENPWSFGYVENGSAFTNSMNGTCFAFFDDDGLGNEAPFSTAEIASPVFDGSLFATYELQLEMIFRQYSDLEYFSILIFDGTEYHRVQDFVEETAEQFSDYSVVNLDLTSFRSKDMQLVFRYDDGNSWGWWVGIDNIKLTGEGEIHDLCTTAEPLEIGKACLQSNNNNAIFSGPISSQGDRLSSSLWYQLDAPADGILNIHNQADYNDQISVFTGNCDNLTEVEYHNHDEQGFHGENMYMNVNQGESYFVRLSGVIDEFGNEHGNNCLSAAYVFTIPTAQSEDLQSSAKNIVIGNNDCTSVNNRYADLQSAPPTENELARADVWFTFTNNSENPLEFIVESDFAEMISIYNTEMTLIYSELYGGDFIVETLENNQQYLVQVAGVFSEIEGETCVKIAEAIIEEPSSDNCADAEILNTNTVFSFTNEGQNFSGIYPSCAIYADNDTWLEFTTNESTDYYIEVDCDFQNTVTIYQGECDNLDEIWCASNLISCDGSPSINNLEPFTTYFIQIASTAHNNQLETGSGTINLTTTPSEIIPLELSVSVECSSTMEANLQIFVSGPEDYELLGHTEADVFSAGDSYLVIVQDEYGCEKTKSGIIDCQPNSCNIQSSFVQVNPSCNSNADGSIEMNPRNGLGPYTYEWSHTVTNENQVEDLIAGIYSVTITDFNGCFLVQEFLLQEPENLLVMTESTDETSPNANDGTAIVTPTGGIFPYEYNWSHGPTSAETNNLAPGAYIVTVTDHNGCQTTQDVLINETGCNFIITSEIDSINCYNGTNGSIEVSGNLEVTQYEWSTEETTPSIDNLSSGMYSVTITAENGCVEIQQFILANPPQINTTVDIQDVLCYGEATGFVTLISTIGNAPFVYSWDDNFIGDQRNDLIAGNYTITTTDAKNCTIEQEIIVSQPDSLFTASKDEQDASCYDSADGVACVFVGGGVEPYSFQWENSNENMAKLEELSAGEYPLTVTDNNGCTHEESLTINAPAPIENEVLSMGINASNEGFINIEVTGGTAPYNIVWYENNEEVGNGENIEGLDEGIYYAVIVDNNGCTFTTNNIMLSLVAIQEIEHSNFSIFPNPTVSEFTLNWVNENIYQYEIDIISADGKSILNQVVSTRSRNSISFAINDASSGLYYVTLLDKATKSQSIILPLVVKQ